MGTLSGIDMNALTTYVVIVAILAVFGLVFRLSSTREARTRAFSERAYRGLDVHDATRGKADVRVVFPTYQGVVIGVYVEKHDLWVSADQAELLLWRLHRANLTRGLLAPVWLGIPLTSFLLYRQQLHRVRQQAARLKKPILDDLA